ncbi:MAG: hypothetical protein KGD63_12285 [Candidatus Lokiarchaeota archaeon]|nr:hypothetical protein [Candidatus Lokiarchaeota archaeon]
MSLIEAEKITNFFLFCEKFIKDYIRNDDNLLENAYCSIIKESPNFFKLKFQKKSLIKPFKKIYRNLFTEIGLNIATMENDLELDILLK